MLSNGVRKRRFHLIGLFSIWSREHEEAVARTAGREDFAMFSNGRPYVLDVEKRVGVEAPWVRGAARSSFHQAPAYEPAGGKKGKS